MTSVFSSWAIARIHFLILRTRRCVRPWTLFEMKWKSSSHRFKQVRCLFALLLYAWKSYLVLHFHCVNFLFLMRVRRGLRRAPVIVPGFLQCWKLDIFRPLKIIEIFFPPPSTRGGSYYGYQRQLGCGQPGLSRFSSWVSSRVLSRTP
jgi:hypothetical protein